MVINEVDWNPVTMCMCFEGGQFRNAKKMVIAIDDWESLISLNTEPNTWNDAEGASK